MLVTAVEERAIEAVEGRLLVKLASDSRPGTGVERNCHGSAEFTGVGGGCSAARRRPAGLIVEDWSA